MNISVTARKKRAIATVVATALSVWALAGCVTTQAQADGSTRVNVSMSQALGLNRAAMATPAAPPPQAVVPQPPRMASTPAQSKPSGIALSDKTRAALAQMLACTTFKSGDDDVVTEMSKKGAWAGGIAHLDQPVIVFGLPVSKVELSGDGSEGTYIAYFSGVDKQQLIKSANLKLSKVDKNFYYRDAKSGQLSFKHTEPEISLKCYIDTEGSYADTAKSAKKKKKN